MIRKRGRLVDYITTKNACALYNCIDGKTKRVKPCSPGDRTIREDRHQSGQKSLHSSSLSMYFIHRSGTYLAVSFNRKTGKPGPHTRGKYRSIALKNLCLYCFGVMIVGSPFPAPARNVDSFTQLSNFLSHV